MDNSVKQQALNVAAKRMLRDKKLIDQEGVQQAKQENAIRFVTAIMLCLLTIACRHTPEVVTPVTVTPIPTPPPSTTFSALTTTFPDGITVITNVDSLTRKTPPVLMVANCRIVAERTKDNYGIYSVYRHPEKIITPNGTWVVTDVGVKFYYYDKQGRVVLEARGPSGTNDYTSYEYGQGAIYTETPTYTEGKGYYTARDTIRLNEQGYQRYYLNRPSYGVEQVYDSEGYLTGYRGKETDYYVKSEGRNTTELRYPYSSSSWFVYTFQYDLSRPALPDPYPFRGRQAANQLMQIDLNAASSGPDRIQLLNNYYVYVYDRLGRVSRRITYDQSYPVTLYWLSTGYYKATVTDYEYECP